MPRRKHDCSQTLLPELVGCELPKPTTLTMTSPRTLDGSNQPRITEAPSRHRPLLGALADSKLSIPLMLTAAFDTTISFNARNGTWLRCYASFFSRC